MVWSNHVSTAQFFNFLFPNPIVKKIHTTPYSYFFSICVSNILPAAFCPDIHLQFLYTTLFCLFESPISNILLIDALIMGMVSLFTLD